MIHNKYFEILKHFLKDYNREIYGRELVGKVSLSQKNIALTLDEMQKKGILSSIKKGNMKYYFLNKKNKMIDKYLILGEVVESIDFFEKHLKLLKFLRGLIFLGFL